MKKNTGKVIAVFLAAWMSLSVLPLAARAEWYEVPEGLEIPGFAWVGDHYEETEHRYGEVVDEEYLVDPDHPGDCTTPAVYWRSCINESPYTGERCGHTAEEAWGAAMQRTKEELAQRRASGEKADFEAIFQNAIAEIDAKYKFNAGGKGHQWIEVDYQPATCEQDGWEAYRVCAVCGEESGHLELPATGHRWIETTAEDGTVHRVCDICGREEIE